MFLPESFSDNLAFSRRRGRKASTSHSADDLFTPPSKIDSAPSKSTSYLWRLVLLGGGLSALLIILAARLFGLQVIYGRENILLSERNRVLSHIVRAERGVVYDRAGTVVARNQPGFSVYWDLQNHPQLSADKNYNSLWNLLGVTPAEVSDIINKAREENKPKALIKRGVDRDTVLKVEANADDYPGIISEVSPVREYLTGQIWSHVLGFVGEASADDLKNLADTGVRAEDMVGKSNLESYFEPDFSGVAGEQLIEVDAFGNRFRELSNTPTTPGDNVTLTIDSGLQKVSYDALAEAAEKNGAVGGAVIVSDVTSGEILALVSYPSYDPNEFSKGISQQSYESLNNNPKKPLFNRAVSGAFPPGSTFKLVVATAALETGTITPSTIVDDKGSISAGGIVFHGWETSGLGPVDLKMALAKSSDIYFYTVGGGYGGQKGVGPEKIAEYARDLGLDALTNVTLSAETSGLIPDPEWKEQNRGEAWYLGNTYNMSIGQGDVLVTPLQLNNVTATIANGGTYFKPQLVKKITKVNGDLVKEFSPEVVHTAVASSKTFDAVKEGMKAVCSPGGTAYPLFNYKVQVAGKTGTSETGKKDKTHAWFTAYAPFDKPQIAVTVFLEEGGEGSHQASPVAKKILDAYFK